MNELQRVTDIDEVIKYAEREAEGFHQTASAFHTDEGVYLQEETRFQYRAMLWENIHEWLEELKERRKKQRPHGKWVLKEAADGKTVGICSECKSAVSTYESINAHKFCWNCGADMRQREGEEK